MSTVHGNRRERRKAKYGYGIEQPKRSRITRKHRKPRTGGWR